MILRAENIKKKYGSRTVVKGVSINVEQGEIVGLLGPNGAGKTTTMRMLSGLSPVDSGDINVAGIDVVKDKTCGPGAQEQRWK